MAEKVTVMVLKVDLGCPSCYKKIKKVLCKFPEIRDQVYDEKQNTVKITVLYCCPEKTRDKVWSKGGKTIKSIEIKAPEKPKEAEKKKEAEKPKEPEKKKEAEKPKEADKPKEAEKPKSDAKTDNKPKQAEPVVKAVAAVPGYPWLYTTGAYSGPYYEGYSAGPSYDGYGIPAGPPHGHEAYGRPIYEPYGRPIHVNRYDYFSEENPSGCTIM